AAVQMAEHAGGRGKDDVEAAPTGFVAEGLRQVRLADAGRPLNEHGLVPLDESTRRQIENLLPIDRGVKRKIETLERFDEIDGGPAQAQLQLLLRTPLDFVFDEPLKEIDVRQFLGDRLLRAHVERGQDAGEPQVFQFRDELMIQLHEPPPVEGKKSVTGRANSGSVVGVATADTAGGAV